MTAGLDPYREHVIRHACTQTHDERVTAVNALCALGRMWLAEMWADIDEVICEAEAAAAAGGPLPNEAREETP